MHLLPLVLEEVLRARLLAVVIGPLVAMVNMYRRDDQLRVRARQRSGCVLDRPHRQARAVRPDYHGVITAHPLSSQYHATPGLVLVFVNLDLDGPRLDLIAASCRNLTLRRLDLGLLPGLLRFGQPDRHSQNAIVVRRFDVVFVGSLRQRDRAFEQAVRELDDLCFGAFSVRSALIVVALNAQPIIGGILRGSTRRASPRTSWRPSLVISSSSRIRRASNRTDVGE